MSSGVIIIADTSVLINFLRIDRMDLIGAHPSAFVATEHVAVEISDSYPDQHARYRAAVIAGYLSEQRVDDPTEVELFLRLRQTPRLGTGECSAISVALNRGHRLAIDDNRAISRALHEAGLAKRTLDIVRTQDIIVTLIQAETLTVEAADTILEDWASNNRFKLKISSFSEIT
ncbi:conserved protein of unknown function [Magnetospirillum gryphiswaldense MSR-1 v2]|jgi:predicted nucleic acid-binding protein|uniref:PIN domain-containing protein n=1 Tax=Magnetospirillum gryphiswaldense (strain DSM 6361 / JCM 21280 / NBRC 15271 / MSR-1) TaxID=431944 RepID=V6F6I6_MAGGM|nr:hypothetical protein [Magnetospirillum gryphiswaldense]CDL00982.1 conserved protein of unknown function [Magnetospirillum gryphiswaldense MSR-1 v2]